MAEKHGKLTLAFGAVHLHDSVMSLWWAADLVSPCPSCPYLLQPKVYTVPLLSAAMLCRQPQATETIFTSSMPSTCAVPEARAGLVTEVIQESTMSI